METLFVEMIAKIDNNIYNYLNIAHDNNCVIYNSDFYHYIVYRTIKKTFKEYEQKIKIIYKYVYINNLDNKTSIKMSCIYFPKYRLMIFPYFKYIRDQSPFQYNMSFTPIYNISAGLYVDCADDLIKIAAKYVKTKFGDELDCTNKNIITKINYTASLIKNITYDTLINNYMPQIRNLSS
jgi:hypothetical protein